MVTDDITSSDDIYWCQLVAFSSESTPEKGRKKRDFAEWNHMIILGLEKSLHHGRVKEINLFN